MKDLLILDPNTCDYRFDNHAGAGPSGTSRWMNCTGSLEMAREFLETLTVEQQVEFARGSEAARQGTTAHAASEAILNARLGKITHKRMDKVLRRLREEPPAGEELTDEMEDFIGEYVDLMMHYADERGAENIRVETRVSAVVPLQPHNLPIDDVYEIPGSADGIVLPTPEDPILVVVDLKYGQGIEVDAVDNTQARTYGVGTLSEICDEDGNLPEWFLKKGRIRYYIAQPRLGGIKVWEESLDELLTWRDDVLSPALTLALSGRDGGATLTPSEKACEFCPANGACSALAKSRMDGAQTLFDEIEAHHYADDEIDTGIMSDATLGDLLQQATLVVKLQAAMKAEAERRLIRGDKVPNFWLVSQSARRKWSSKAPELLADIPDVWKEPVLVSPKTAMDFAKKELSEDMQEKIAAVIDNPPAYPKINTGVSDRRKKWEGDMAERTQGMFD